MSRTVAGRGDDPPLGNGSRAGLRIAITRIVLFLNVLASG
jgi:hypothetical protein